MITDNPNSEAQENIVNPNEETAEINLLLLKKAMIQKFMKKKLMIW